MAVREFTIYDMIQRNAQVFPKKEAVVHGDVRLSFFDYLDKCNRLAAGLAYSGVLPGDRVAIVAENCLEYILAYGAAAALGAIVVPINWRLTFDEIRYIMTDTSPKVIAVGRGFHETVKKAAVQGDLNSLLFSFGHSFPDGWRPFDDLYVGGSSFKPYNTSINDGYVIIHTAAVEGRAKGALLSQGNIIALCAIIGEHFRLGPDDAHICFLPLFHIAGLAVSMSVMSASGKNVVLERFEPERVLEQVEKERGTIFYSFPPMLDTLIETNIAAGRNISSMRYIGGINPPETITRFGEVAPGVRFGVMYGQTEALSASQGWFDERPGSAGKAGAQTRIRLVDDNDREVSQGAIGEICVKSPSVFLGYWGLPEETEWALRGGWHHTGDMGRLDEDGFLWYTGRKATKELIKTGGENVYPVEVEKVILEHPNVSEVSIIGVPDKRWGEAIKAVCVLEPNCNLAEAELIDFVSDRLARYKKPRQVVFVDSLPKMSDGTIDRPAVKKEHGGIY